MNCETCKGLGAVCCQQPDEQDDVYGRVHYVCCGSHERCPTCDPVHPKTTPAQSVDSKEVG